MTKKKKIASKVKKTADNKKSEKSVPVSFTMLKIKSKPAVIAAYDKRNGKRIYVKDQKYIPKRLRETLSKKEMSEFLVKDAK